MKWIKFIVAVFVFTQINYSVAQNHNIGTGDLTACTGTLLDAGGNSDYGNNESFVETYCSDVAGQCITITFNSFSTESCCDALSIYDGSTIGSPLIGTYNGTNSPGTVTGTSGCITFQWSSDGSVTYPGWNATISCAACPTCIDGIQNGLETGIDCGGPSCSPCPCGMGPVPNDEPCCATVATVNPDALCGSVTSSTILNATASPINPAACGGTEDDDVWFEFVATNASHYISLINVAGSTSDLYHSLWEGACGAPTLVAGTCSDPNSQTVNGLTPGNTYYVRVYTYTSTGGQTSTFDLCVGTPPPAPANDECSGAFPLTVNPDAICTDVTAGTVASATPSPQASGGCFGTDDDDVWFSFIATGPSHYVSLLNVSGSTTDMYHSVWDGCGGGSSLVPGTCSDGNSQTVNGLTPGNTYYVRVYTYTSTSGQTSIFDVCIGTPPPPPANDECAGAFPLIVNPTAACTDVTAGTVASATPSPQATGGCFGTDDDDVWFSFVATGPTHYVSLLNVSGSTTDMYHSVWDGCGGGSSLVPGTCSDGNSQTVGGLTPGNTYYVRVYTYTSTTGQTSIFDVCIGTPPPPPTNDECATAISAVVNPDAICNDLTPGYTVGATSSMAGCAGTADDDVWFSFVALDPNQQIELLNATGTTDLVHELFSGPCGSLTSLGCSDPNISTYTGLVVGNTYWVRVYTYSSVGSSTSFDLCITSPCGISGTAPSCSLNYTHSTTAYAPANYNTGTSIAFSDDRFAPSYSSIGFPFCFDGVLYNDVLVSSNGYLIFPGCYSAAPTETSVTTGGYSAYSMYTSVPNTDDAPRNAIMGPWHDIDPSISGSVIRTNIEGVAPNRVFVAKFNTVGMFSCTTDDFTGQIMLYETSYDIEVHIGEKTVCSGWNGGGAILGLHNYDGTQSVVPAGYNYPTQWTVPTNSPEGHKFTSNCPECFVPLPVELIEFIGEPYDGFNTIEWKTVTEKNNDFFVLEHSNGGAEFEAIAIIPGAGNSTEMRDYQFRHDTPMVTEYYRLRQVDFNGSTSYSNIISVRAEAPTSLSMYPNPSSGQLFIDIVSTKEDVLMITYMDLSGKQSYEEISVNEINTIYELSGFLALDKGMYIIQISDAKGEILATEKVVKK